MSRESAHSRREFILAGTATGTGLLMAGISGVAAAAEQSDGQMQNAGAKEEEISPAEDLMREHGVLNRILLIYDESLRRINTKNSDVFFKTLAIAAKIIRTFIEDYHEKLEENHLFPLFEKADKLTGLVKVLREQHDAGRRLTDEIQRLTTAQDVSNEINRQKLGRALDQFVRMYRPHEAREDTVLFPAIRSLMTPKDYDALGDQFEDKEHELFGEHGFENIVDQVAGLEKTMGIEDLSKFTPQT
jgi:hemerythrin-like domain-containing protein